MTPTRENNTYGQNQNHYKVNQLHDGEKLKTVTDLIRDISGATFNEVNSPLPVDAAQSKKNSLAPRSNSMVKSSTTGGNAHSSADATLNTVGVVNRRRGASANPLALRSVNEVFSSSQNRAKFCMPLGLNSAREIETCI